MADVESSFWQKVRSIVNGKSRAITVRPQTITQKGNADFVGMKGLQGFSVSDIVGNDPLRVMRDGASKKISPDRAMQKITGWVFAAINAIAAEIAGIDFELYEINGESHEKKDTHEALDILDAVNPFQTGPELKWMTAQHLEATGNAYWLLHGVKNETDKPDMIFILRPDQMKVCYDKTVYPYMIKGYEYRDDNHTYNYKPFEIIHFKYPDPNNPYEGIGTIQSVAHWIDNDNYAMEYNRQFFLGGAHMDGVFETEYTTEEQVEAMKIAFESNHQGVENAHKTGFLPKGVHWKATQANAKEMDFVHLLEMTRDFILAGFRVSRTILGTAESDTNRATAETADYVFAKRTIKPKMQLICSYINEYYVPRFGKNLYITFKDPTPEDKQFRAQEMKIAMGDQPVLSVNEARRDFMGVGPIEGGDMVKTPQGMVDVGSPTEEGKPLPATVAPKSKSMARVATTKAAQANKVRINMSKKMADAVTEKLKEITEIKKKGFIEMTKDEYYFIWKDFNSRIEAHEPILRKKMQEINEKQKKEVLENARDIFSKAYKTKAGVPNLFDKDKWITITVAGVNPILEPFYQKEGEIAGAGIGEPGINIMETEAGKSALDHAISLFAESYNQTTLDQLKEKLGEALASNEGVASAADLISGIYDFADTTRATAVAQTELFRIGNEAGKQAWAQAGVEKMEWEAYDDDLTCEFCHEMNGRVAGVNDNFLDNGDSVKGTDGGEFSVSYDDVGAPPLHTNCRCSLKPVDPNY